MFWRVFTSSFILTSFVFAHESGTKHKYKSHNIPAGVMRSHVHNKGEAMAMYMTSGTFFEGVRGSRAAALARYNNISDNMTMKMDMLGIMYGLTDDITLSVMGGYMYMKMNTEGTDTGKHSHSVNGFGDTSIDAMYRIFSNDTQHLQANFGIILPTGSITKTHKMHANHGHGHHTHEMRNGYNMQIGTGSYSITPGLSYTRNLTDLWSFSTQANAIIRLNDNKEDYRFGNIYNLTGWLARSINDMLSLTARLDFTKVNAINGVDSQISQTASPMGVPSLTYRDQLTPLLGVNVNLKGSYEGVRVQFEVGSPLYQRIGDGMPKQRIIVSGGLQYSF